MEGLVGCQSSQAPQTPHIVAKVVIRSKCNHMFKTLNIMPGPYVLNSYH